VRLVTLLFLTNRRAVDWRMINRVSNIISECPTEDFEFGEVILRVGDTVDVP
jgi:hypothetical protein